MDKELDSRLSLCIYEALDVLASGRLETIEITSNKIIFRYPIGNIWIYEENLKIYLMKGGFEFSFSEKEMDAICYLFKVRNKDGFIQIIQTWIDKRDEAKAKKNHINKLIQIQKDLSYLFGRINSVIEEGIKE